VVGNSAFIFVATEKKRKEKKRKRKRKPQCELYKGVVSGKKIAKIATF